MAETMVNSNMITALVPAAAASTGDTPPVVAADQEALLHSDNPAVAANKRICFDMYRTILQGGRADRVREFIGPTYIQHNPRIGNGLASARAFYAAVQAQGVPLAYTSWPLVVADGNFVLVGSEGYLGRLMDEEPNADMPRFAYTVFYDLFRVNGGKVVEHWDVIQRIDPGRVPHGNGLF